MSIEDYETRQQRLADDYIGAKALGEMDVSDYKDVQEPRETWYVYVSGPYTLGDTVINTQRSVQTAEILRAEGYTPFVPHLSMLWHLISPHEYKYWLSLDLDWVANCDALLRVSGESHGADIEVAHARKVDVRVYTSIKTLMEELPILRKPMSLEETVL